LNKLNSKRLTDLIGKAREVVEKQLEEAVSVFGTSKIHKDDDGLAFVDLNASADFTASLLAIAEQLTLLDSIQSLSKKGGKESTECRSE
jgi:hypothetical protein